MLDWCNIAPLGTPSTLLPTTFFLFVWKTPPVTVLRTFSGHKSGITCVDFHPFGDFFASGSLDSNIKLWDTRKKSCMYAYKVRGKKDNRKKEREANKKEEAE